MEEGYLLVAECTLCACDPVERTPQTLTHGEGRGKREADSDGRLGSE